MRVGEPLAAKVRHRVGLAPDDVVQNPVAQVLQNGADAKDVVIAADDPQAAVGLQHALGGFQPVMRELVIGAEILELVPIVVHAVDAGIVGPQQLAAELEVVGRIGKYGID